jgi:hypothetical protein
MAADIPLMGMQERRPGSAGCVYCSRAKVRCRAGIAATKSAIATRHSRVTPVPGAAVHEWGLAPAARPRLWLARPVRRGA